MKKNNDSELEQIIDGIESGQISESNKNEDNEDRASRCFDLALGHLVAIFHDQYGEPHAILPDDQKRCVKISSNDFNRWFARLIVKETGKSLQRNTITSAVMMLEGYAVHDAPGYTLDVRIVSHEGAIWYDLGNGSAVRIDKNKWVITSDVPIIFRKVGHQNPQVEPVGGSDIHELLGFFNLPSNGSGMTMDQLLLLVWLIFAFIPENPHPILTLYGAQGSAKTTAFRMLKALIDPSQIDTLSLSDSQREMVQIASHHYFVPFDNLSHLTFDYSDLLCRIVTGDGFSKRALYTDDDDIVRKYRRVIGLNGINITADKADLLDRSLLIGLERIEHFEGEGSFKKRFQEAQPRILGSIFDVLVKTLAIIDSVPEPEQMRMADFARYGIAIAKAIGLEGDDFLVAYEDNIAHQNEEALNASLIGGAIINLMENEPLENGEWTDTPTEFLNTLNVAAIRLGIDVKAKAWPKNSHWVTRRANEIKTNLGRAGYCFKPDYYNNKTITITKMDEHVKVGEKIADLPTKSTESTLPVLWE
jgi:hypothetical protein